MIMALQVFTDLMALLWQHPLLSGLALLLFTPPFFPIVKFFSPLLISTALFMLALFTMGGPETTSTSTTEDNWEFRRAADVQVWEDKSVSRRPKGDGSWMEYMQMLAESSYAWIETKLQNQNSKVSAVNDDNVSILQEASWPTATRNDDEEPAPIEDINVSTAITLFKPDLKVKVPELGEGVLKHEPLSTLEVPNKTVTDSVIDNSPSTDVEDSDRLILSTVRRDSMNASLGLSDDGTPVALSKSGKLKQIEMLGELIEEKEQHRGDVPVVLMATIAEQVEAVKEKLEDFKHSPEHENKPGSPLFKQGKKEKEGTTDVLFKQEEKEGTKDVVLKKSRSAISDDSSSGEEMLSDSDSDSEFEIFPPVDPAKMKLHPPVKLDILELEKKLGTSLSQRTRAPKGEITELH